MATTAPITTRSGLAGARTDLIAAEAGVNKALLYYYFQSKEKLCQAVLEDHFEQFNRQALEVLGGPGSAREVLLRLCRPALRFHQRSAPPCAAVPAVYECRRPVLQMLGRADAYAPASLKRRKQEVLDFIRHALFVHP